MEPSNNTGWPGNCSVYVCDSFLSNSEKSQKNKRKTKYKRHLLKSIHDEEYFNRLKFLLHFKFKNWYYYYHNFNPDGPVQCAAHNLHQNIIYHVQTIFQQPINKTNVPIFVWLWNCIINFDGRNIYSKWFYFQMQV